MMIGDERKCSMCGRRFIAMDISQWAYKRMAKHMKYFCSYNCMRKYDMSLEEKRKKDKHDRWLKQVKANAERDS